MLKSTLFVKLDIKIHQIKLFNYFIRSLYNCNLGKTIKQEFDLSEKYLDEVIVLWEILIIFEEISSENWLNLTNVQKFVENLLKSKDKTIQPFALFCPSYLKEGKPGLSPHIGKTTITGVNNFIYFCKKLQAATNSLYSIKPLIHFGVLALELYDSLEIEYWIKNIEANRKQIEEKFLENNFDCTVTSTSEIPYLFKKIGYSGNKDDLLLKRFVKETKTIFDRNYTFYVDNMKLSEEYSIERTSNSITTYNILGHYYRENLINPVFFYTANSYEKAIAYNLEGQSLLIIYPKKDDYQNIIDFSKT
jgi:hypothetical protein